MNLHRESITTFEADSSNQVEIMSPLVYFLVGFEAKFTDTLLLY